jgi:hypothetical protein
VTSSKPPELHTGVPKSVHGELSTRTIWSNGGAICDSVTAIDSSSIGLTASATTKLIDTGLPAVPPGGGCKLPSTRNGRENASMIGSARLPATTFTGTWTLSKLAVAKAPATHGKATAAGLTPHC